MSNQTIIANLNIEIGRYKSALDKLTTLLAAIVEQYGEGGVIGIPFDAVDAMDERLDKSGGGVSIEFLADKSVVVVSVEDQIMEHGDRPVLKLVRPS